MTVMLLLADILFLIKTVHSNIARKANATQFKLELGDIGISEKRSLIYSSKNINQSSSS